MDEDKIFKLILTNTYTLTLLNKRLRVLKTYLLSKLFQSASPALQDEIQTEVNWLYQLGGAFYQSFNSRNVYSIFEKLEKNIKDLDPLILYLPFDPTPNQINQIGTYLRNEYGETFVFDVKYDPLLIGGCAMVWKGIYKDYSLRARIQDNSQILLENFKRVINNHI